MEPLHNTIKLCWGMCWLGVGVALAALVFLPSPPAKAGGSCDLYYGCPRHIRHYRRHKPVHHREREIRYYADPEWRDRRDLGRCLPETVSVVSTEHNSEKAAKEAARKLWMVQVSWRFGGQWIDTDNAADFLERCGPSNPMDTVTGRLIEGAQKLAGSDGQNVRCEIKARPCNAPLEQVEGHRSADWETGMKR